MNIDVTDIGLGVLRIQPPVFRDERGHFMETWKRDAYAALGLPSGFTQDNISFSRKNVLRGLHFQMPEPQGKLITVLSGKVFDVAVDIRRDSQTFGQWTASELDGDTMTQLWIPEGFAHGFVTLSNHAIFQYKCTRPYEKTGDQAIRWNDPDICIDWPVTDPVVSDKDGAAPLLSQIDSARLPGSSPPKP